MKSNDPQPEVNQLTFLGPSVATSLVLGQANEPTITASTADISLLIDETETVDVRVSGLSSGEKINLQFFAQHTELIRVEPTSLILDKNDATYKVNITGLSPGYVNWNWTGIIGRQINSLKSLPDIWS